MRGGTGGLYSESSRDLIQALKGSLPLPPCGGGVAREQEGRQGHWGSADAGKVNEKSPALQTVECCHLRDGGLAPAMGSVTSEAVDGDGDEGDDLRASFSACVSTG